MSNIENINGNLVVSCQALEEEPLHSSFIMGRMALAAKVGGAKGIRANSTKDIIEIQKTVDLPIIGIIKKNYGKNPVFITSTIKEVDELVKVNCSVIATDATNRIRPDNKSLKEFFEEIKEKYPNQKIMADCSTVSEAIYANKIGFDYIGTTLVGYTEESKNDKIENNDFKIIKDILKNVNKPVIAEGNIDSPSKARRVLELGCYSVVVGSIITRPQIITKRFVDEIKNI